MHKIMYYINLGLERLSNIIVTNDILLFIANMVFIDQAWKLIDNIEFGQPQPSVSDLIAGAIIAVLIIPYEYDVFHTVECNRKIDREDRNNE